MKKIGLKDKPKVIDLTKKTGTVETLTEARINCTKEEKVRPNQKVFPPTKPTLSFYAYLKFYDILTSTVNVGFLAS